MSYVIMLSDREVADLGWLVNHGYWPDEAYDEMTLHEDEEQDEPREPSNEQRRWVIPEHAAWSIIDMSLDDEAYLTCCGGDLLLKLVDLEGRIV